MITNGAHDSNARFVLGNHRDIRYRRRCRANKKLLVELRSPRKARVGDRWQGTHKHVIGRGGTGMKKVGYYDVIHIVELTV